MSSLMVAKAATLKPEIRLAQSVSEFEASLSNEHKATFRSYRSQSLNKPIDTSDVMRLTAEIDRRAVQQNGGGQCFGPRLTNILQAVQQYAALGDVIVGGSQNIIACGIWSLLRLTLLALVSFSSYMEKLSKLLMVAGRKAPRYEQMALLYHRSSDLQSSLSEYFIVVVQLCRQLYKATQKTTFGSYLSFLSDLDLKEHETSLRLWADCIKDEVTLLTARKITEQSTFLGVLSKNSNYQSHREQLRTRFRVLEACSTYNHQTTWKEIRKCGNSTILSQLDQYPEWKAGAASSTLLCTGKLGFGKSVLLANMVDELNLNSVSTDTAVIYFFCRHDIQESLQARTIIGSIARQLINANPSQLPDELIDTTSISNLDHLLDFILSIIPRDTEAFLVLDGLDECDNHERDTTLKHLRQLQEAFIFKICCSFRSDGHLKGALGSTIILLRRRISQLPEENPDISTFVTAELKRCIESGRLCISESTLISEIQHALVHRAQGMFLWTVLQIASLCTASSDEEIREALEDLPKGLPETFSRILRKCRGRGEKYQKLIFQLCMVARRPLTTEELREALSVVPYNTEWNPARLINNIFSVLQCCGGLVTIDEEELTVRYLHHSVKQYLLGEFDLVDRPILTLKDADQTMGKVVVTYLNYNTFENAMSTTVFTQMMAQDMPSNIVKSTFGHSTPIRQGVLSIFKRRKRRNSYQHDMRDTLIRAKSASSQNVQYKFHDYAHSHWLSHVQWVFLHQDPGALNLLMVLLEKGRVNIHDKDSHGETLLFKAVESASSEVVKDLLNYGSDTHDSNLDDCTALHVAAHRGELSIISSLLDSGANIEAQDFRGMTALSCAVSQGHTAAVDYLLKSGANIEARDFNGWTALSRAVHRRDHFLVKYLLEQGANSRHKDADQHTPLLFAVCMGHKEVVQTLLSLASHDNLEDRDPNGRTAATKAAYRGFLTILGSFLDMGANIEARDNTDCTPLILSAHAGKSRSVKFLLHRGASIAAADKNGQTALFYAARGGHNDVVQILLEQNADVDAQEIDGWTPLLIAAYQSHRTVVQLLIAHGANIEAETKTGASALSMAVLNEQNTMIKLLDSYIGIFDYERQKITGSTTTRTQEQIRIARLQAYLKNISTSQRMVERRALFRAIDDGDQALIMALIGQDPGIEVEDEHGATPLLRAAAVGHLFTVTILTGNGADVHARTRDGKTALHLSAERGHLGIVKYLLDNDSVIGALTDDGKSALDLAFERQMYVVGKYLTFRGAR